MKKPIPPVKPLTMYPTPYIENLILTTDSISVKNLLPLIKDKDISEIFLCSTTRDYGDYGDDSPTIKIIERKNNPDYEPLLKEVSEYSVKEKEYKEEMIKYYEWLDNLALEHENE